MNQKRSLLFMQLEIVWGLTKNWNSVKKDNVSIEKSKM